MKKPAVFYLIVPFCVLFFGVLFLGLVPQQRPVFAQSCTKDSDCPPVPGPNTCCGDSVCNDYQTMFCNPYSDPPNQCAPDFTIPNKVHTDPCPCGCSNNRCNDCAPPPTCNLAAEYPSCCGDGLSQNVKRYEWSDGSGVCKWDVGNCDQPDAACSSKTCDLKTEYNECCADGLSKHIKKYEWSDGSGVCKWDVGDCNQPDATCKKPVENGACDQGCGGACGYRRSDGSCTVDNSCCHRECSGGTSCVTVAGAGANSCDNDASCITPSGCTATYSLNPAAPEQPNTNVTVGISATSTNLGCVALYQDNVNQSCSIDTTKPPGNYICNVNSGAPGSNHTLQLKFGQASLYPAGTPCGTPVSCNATSYQTIVPPPPTPTISTSLSCIVANGYSGSGFTISWGSANPAVTRVDISTSSSFNTYSSKSVSGNSTTAPAGFSNNLTFNSSTTYYVRLFNGVSTGNYASFTTPALCPPCPEGLGACGALPPPPAWSIGPCNGTWVYENNTSYNSWCAANANPTRGYCYRCDTSAITPWIQATGDVHSNTGIKAPGGP